MKILLFLLLILFLSCRIPPENLNYVLEQSGASRIELEKLLAYYPKGSQKYKAAVFLLVNMPFHESLEGRCIESYRDSILWYKERGLNAPADQLWRKIVREQGPFVEYSLDLETVSADYLLQNIEEAFDAWEIAPWYKEIDFKTFCHHILPYRIQDEPLVEWRKPLREKYLPLIEGITHPKEAFDKIYTHIRNEFTLKSVAYPYTRDAVLLDISMRGECASRTQYIVSVMRSLAIPAGYDFCKIWANYGNTGHSWVSFIGKKGETFTVVAPDSVSYSFDRIPGGALPPVASYRFDTSVYQVDSIKKVAKVFRKSFVGNNTPDIDFYENTPSLLQDIHSEDVTKYYSKTLQDIKIKNETAYTENLYISTFNQHKGGWLPIANAKQKGKYIESKDLFDDLVYLPVYYEDEEIKPLSNPILLSGKASRVLNPDTLQLQDIVIKRKYIILSLWIERWAQVLGSQIEVSDDREFTNPEEIEILFQMDSIPMGPVYIELKESTRPYRYVRFKAEDGKIPSLAELHFYTLDDKGEWELLDGKYYAHRAKEQNLRALYDGKIHTDLYLKNEHWIGMDLGKENQKNVNRIRLCLRNDANWIEVGDEYELFYFDKDWISLGNRIATSDTLMYQNVPTNSLFWLKNHTKGKEERIFTYENGKQSWW